MRWNEAEAKLRPLVKKVLREYADELEDPRLLEFVLVSKIAMWIWSNFGLEPDEEEDVPLRTGPQYPCISRGDLLDMACRAREIGEQLDHYHSSAEDMLLWKGLVRAIEEILR